MHLVKDVRSERRGLSLRVARIMFAGRLVFLEVQLETIRKLIPQGTKNDWGNVNIHDYLLSRPAPVARKAVERAEPYCSTIDYRYADEDKIVESRVELCAI